MESIERLVKPTEPFHSRKERRVYHDQLLCTQGNNIETRYLALGTGGLPLCDDCAMVAAFQRLPVFAGHR